MRLHCAAAAAALMLASGPATAKDEPVASPLIAALEKCLAIPGDAERLACTDVAARKLVEASRTKEVVVVDRDEMKKTRRSLFGFSLPRIALFGKGGPDDVEEVARIEMKATSVVPLGYGKYAFTMEDGAQWRTTEGWQGSPQPKSGDTLTIKRATMGSYMISIKGGRSARAMRVG